MPMSWNADADARLLAAVIATSDVKVNYAAVAAMMGPECTAKAVTHRIGKLKEIAQIPPVATPSKPKTPAKRARKGKSETNGAGDGDDNDSSESPTKKTKATPKKKAASSVSTPTPIKGEPVEMNRVKSEEGVSGEKEEELS